MKMCPRTRKYVYGAFSNVPRPCRNGTSAIYIPHRGTCSLWTRVLVGHRMRRGIGMVWVADAMQRRAQPCQKAAIK